MNPTIAFIACLCGIVAAMIATLRNRSFFGWLIAGTFVPVVTILILIAATDLPPSDV